MKKQPVHDRGLLLTIMVGVGLISIPGALYDLIVFHGDMWIKSILPFWYQWYMFIQLVIKGVSLYGVWKWKKWGAYLLLGSYVLGVPLSFFALPNVVPGIGRAIAILPIVGVGLWIWALQSRWKNFK